MITECYIFVNNATIQKLKPLFWEKAKLKRGRFQLSVTDRRKN